MKSLKIGFTTVGKKPRRQVEFSLAPTDSEIERRAARYMDRKRTLNSETAAYIWQHASEVEFEAGGTPTFSEEILTEKPKPTF